jgi:myo-inositol-1(or 4)-monophosphatase
MRYYNSCLSSNLPLDVRKNATTSADKASEAEILATLERHENIRSDTVITEEAAREQLKPARKGYTWVIDPLDGTNNFRNRIPLFCTAIGILRDGQPHIGVIYDPMAGDLYYAITGSPARVWCVERGEVSNLSTDLETTDLIDCMVATHISSKPEHAAKLVAENLILRVADKTRHVRVIGSGQLALAYVASGRLQVYFQYGSHPWDQVAGVVLVRSAGGAVREIHSGSDWEYANPDFFASGSQKVGKLFAGLLGVQT